MEGGVGQGTVLGVPAARREGKAGTRDSVLPRLLLAVGAGEGRPSFLSLFPNQ